jgi:hypothetical protein
MLLSRHQHKPQSSTFDSPIPSVSSTHAQAPPRRYLTLGSASGSPATRHMCTRPTSRSLNRALPRQTLRQHTMIGHGSRQSTTCSRSAAYCWRSVCGAACRRIASPSTSPAIPLFGRPGWYRSSSLSWGRDVGYAIRTRSWICSFGEGGSVARALASFSPTLNYCNSLSLFAFKASGEFRLQYQWRNNCKSHANSIRPSPKPEFSLQRPKNRKICESLQLLPQLGCVGLPEAVTC